MKRTRLCTALLLLAIPIARIAGSDQPAQPDPVAQPAAANALLVEADGFTISRAQLEEEQRVHRHEVEEMLADGISPPAVAWMGLQNLINKRLVLVRATEADRHEAQKSFADNMRAYKAKLKVSDGEFEQALAAQLANWQISRRRWEERGIEHCLVEIVTKRELGADITDEAIAKYYQARLVNFDVPEKIRAHYLLLSTVDRSTGLRLTPEQMTAKQARLQTILQRVRDGEDLAVLARQHSEAGPARDPDGLYAFSRGQSTPEFEQAAFALQPGELSGIITTDSGYQILRVSEKIPARRLRLEEAATPIRNSIMFEESVRYLQRLKAGTRIRILDPELQAESVRGGPASPVPMV